jgi:hypothetical protein
MRSTRRRGLRTGPRRRRSSRFDLDFFRSLCAGREWSCERARRRLCVIAHPCRRAAAAFQRTTPCRTRSRVGLAVRRLPPPASRSRSSRRPWCSRRPFSRTPSRTRSASSKDGRTAIGLRDPSSRLDRSSESRLRRSPPALANRPTSPARSQPRSRPRSPSHSPAPNRAPRPRTRRAQAEMLPGPIAQAHPRPGRPLHRRLLPRLVRRHRLLLHGRARLRQLAPVHPLRRRASRRRRVPLRRP